MKRLSAITGLLSLSVLIPMTARATVGCNWILIDDFESYTEQNPPSYAAATNISDYSIEIFEDVGGNVGQSAWFSYGTVLGSVGDTWYQIPLPEEIPTGGTGTVYIEFYMDSYDLNWHFAATKLEDLPDETPNWSNMVGIVRYNAAEPLDVDAHSGMYLNSNPTFLPNLNEWYKVWIVWDNSFNQAQEQTGYYSVYVQGETDPEPTQLTCGTNMNSQLTIRNKAFDSIKQFVIATNSQHGTGVEITLVDNIYFTQGMPFTDPTAGETCGGGPCGFEVVAGVHVNTGDFLGWVFAPDGEDANWVYVWKIDSWVYVPTCPTSAGGWAYIAN